MTIKKAYKIATTIIGYTPEEVEEAKAILLKSLDRLDQLEKENRELKSQRQLILETNKKIAREAAYYKQQIKDFEEKLNIDFEDSADELCKALTERDKLYDEKLELQKENEELKQYKDILEEYGLDLESPKIRDVLICGMMYKDYRKAIKILKARIGAGVYHIKKSCYYMLSFGYRKVLITKEQYELLKDVFESVGDSDD